ncbi:Mss4-like protein [Aspergillus pseudodeflectus]|uniref:Mss4-like protein n=1 Tax=Aspergillus pseudodeflectus TaxID=176178 RepID=A0ABR4JPR7_9EURO
MESKASCNCGAVTLTLQYDDANQLSSILCHCVNCAKSSGSVGANYIIVPRTAVSVDGDLTTYVDRKCESGLPLERKFCGACGSPVMAYSAKLGDALCSKYSAVAGTNTWVFRDMRLSQASHLKQLSEQQWSRSRSNPLPTRT